LLRSLSGPTPSRADSSLLPTLMSFKEWWDGTSSEFRVFTSLCIKHTQRTHCFFFLRRTGCVLCAYYLIATEPSHPPPSIGFPGYIYPNDEICALYDGGPCGNDTTLCCYNETKWCDDNGENCQADVRGSARCFFTITSHSEFTGLFSYSCMSFIAILQNGAYPIGDQRIFIDQMSNPQALTPFPNAIFWNWATIFILAFGNCTYYFALRLL